MGTLDDAGVRRFGRLDIFVNYAGVLRWTDLEHETAEAFEKPLAVNCPGAFLGRQAVLPHPPGCRRRGDRQHVFDGGDVFVGRLRGVRIVEVGGPRPHQGDRARIGREQHPRECRRARTGPHADDRGGRDRLRRLAWRRRRSGGRVNRRTSPKWSSTWCLMHRRS